MKAVFLFLPMLFSAMAFANDTSYPAIQFEVGSISKIEGYENSMKAELIGGDANNLFNMMTNPVGVGPKEVYALTRGLVLLAKNANGQPAYVAINCSKGGYNYETGKIETYAQTKCSVALVDSPYQSDTFDFKAPVCGKK